MRAPARDYTRTRGRSLVREERSVIRRKLARVQPCPSARIPLHGDVF